MFLWIQLVSTMHKNIFLATEHECHMLMKVIPFAILRIILF